MTTIATTSTEATEAVAATTIEAVATASAPIATTERKSNRDIRPALFDLAIEDLQARWGCSRQTTYRVISEPFFPAPLRLAGRSWFRTDEIVEWESQQKSVLLPAGRKTKARKAHDQLMRELSKEKNKKVFDIAFKNMINDVS